MFYCSLTDNNLMPLHRQVVLLDWSEKAPWPSIITQSVCLITSQQFIAYHFDSNFINRIFFFFTLRTSKCIAIVRWNVIENTDSYTVVYNVMLHAVFFLLKSFYWEAEEIIYGRLFLFLLIHSLFYFGLARK